MSAFSQLDNITAVKSNHIKSEVIFEVKMKLKCFVISLWKMEIDISLKTNIFGWENPAFFRTNPFLECFF